MRRYTVHHPSSEPSRMIAQADRFVFVKEGFCWPALFIPLLWTIYRRMWLVLGGYLIAVVASSAVFALASLSEVAQVVSGLTLNLVFAFFANDLRRWSLQRHGFSLIDVVFATSLDVAERRFFNNLLAYADAETPPTQPPIPLAVSGSATRTDEPVIGLFPEPDPGS